MRQSTAQSRHQLLPACGACGACEWCVSAGRRCSGCGFGSSAYGLRASTQTRPFSSVSAPAVGSAVAMSRERHAVAQLATGGSCVDARPTPVGMAAASGSPTAALLAAIAWQGQQDFAATAAPIGVCRGRECGNQQPSHVISSSLHVMHAAHANGAYQQAAAASTVRVASGDGPRATCSRSGSYSRQLHRR